MGMSVYILNHKLIEGQGEAAEVKVTALCASRHEEDE